MPRRATAGVRPPAVPNGRVWFVSVRLAPGTAHQFASAVRAHVCQLLHTASTEGALEAADVRLAVRSQHDAAPLALAAQLEHHHDTAGFGAVRSSASQPTSRARAASSAAAPPRSPKSRFAHRRYPTMTRFTTSATILNGDTRFVSSKTSSGSSAVVATKVRYSAHRFMSQRPTASSPSSTAYAAATSATSRSVPD